MPSKLPVISIRTNEDNIIKIKTIAKMHNRSVSNEMEILLEDYIAQFEREYGPIIIESMGPTEIMQDIKDRISKIPPYGDNTKDLDESTIKELYDRFEDYHDEISLEEFTPLVIRCTVKRKGTTYIEHNVLKEKVQTLYYRKKKLE